MAESSRRVSSPEQVLHIWVAATGLQKPYCLFIMENQYVYHNLFSTHPHISPFPNFYQESDGTQANYVNSEHILWAYNFLFESMVQLSFTVQIEKDLDTVWDFFSEFTSLPKWDPNTKACTALKNVPGKVGS